VSEKSFEAVWENDQEPSGVKKVVYNKKQSSLSVVNFLDSNKQAERKCFRFLVLSIYAFKIRST
jgi:hypothetical protein